MAEIKKSFAEILKTTLSSDAGDSIGAVALKKTLQSYRIRQGNEVDPVPLPFLRDPKPRQAQAIWAAVKTFAEGRSHLINGAPGTGKTLMAIGAAGMLKSKGYQDNVLVITPANVTRKWCDEVAETLPSSHATAVRCRNILADQVPVCSCCGTSFGKRAERLEEGTPCATCGATLQKTAIGQLRTVLQTPVEPGITRFIILSDGNIRENFHHETPDLRVTTWSEKHRKLADEKLILSTAGCVNKEDDVLARCPKCGQTFQVDGPRKADVKFLTVAAAKRQGQTVCTAVDPHTKKKCGEIWSDIVTESQTYNRRSPALLAKWIRRNKLAKLVIVDEGHRSKGDGVQGEYTRALSKAGEKVLYLTATLTNGYANSVHYILQDLVPGLCKANGFGYHNEVSFANTYGAAEVRSWTDPKNGKKVVKTLPRPGISSDLFREYLVGVSDFIEMDAVTTLPPKIEQSITIPMDTDMRVAYDHFTDHFCGELKELVEKALGGKKSKELQSLVSAYVQARLAWVDTLEGSTTTGKITLKDGTKIEVKLPDFTYDPGYGVLTNKEVALAQRILAENEEGRLCLVYYTNVAAPKRVANALQANGVKITVLPASVRPEDREEWMAEAAAEGYNVICNPVRVKEGIDLLDFPTIISCQPLPALADHVQSMMRSWRIGQNKEVRLFYMAYANCAQMIARDRLALRLVQAEEAEGRLSTSGLKVNAGKSSILEEMVLAILEGNEDLLKSAEVVMQEAAPAGSPVFAPAAMAAPVVEPVEDIPWAPLLVKVITRVTEIFRRKPKVVLVPDVQLALFDFMAS
ncbi:DEAD/DEAH box helicase family protein (plasmid) [Trichlorobacter lovleyi]|uniref:DEAD/DEAH box helicase family protein n=1 Tax=Trichlorobacter lovleyi TaxID=313985 RepID=UPI00223F6383|nr:DEAD/DEAH box helicase family protein [Trichlorobacter lovleyi]QOX81066.1 DEAD/DEAH box helicase family protein [Trichlorobacter lovleyi]